MLTNHKRMFILAIGVILTWIIVYFFVIDSLKEQTAELKQELEDTRSKIGSTISQGEVIDEGAVKKISDEIERIENKLVKIKEKILFKARPDYLVDQTHPDLLIKFNVLLGKKYSQLRNEATAQGIKIPSSFGFPTGAISPDELPLHYEQLDIIDQIISLAIEKGCREILSIGMEKEAREFLDTNILSNEFIKKDVIVIKLKADFRTASEIIYALNTDITQGERFLAIPRISLKSDTSEVDLLTMTLAIGAVNPVRD